MEQNLLSGIKKGSAKTFRELCERELNRLWFISFHITKKVSLAAPLLIAGWENALKSLSECDSPPEESFCAAVCGEMYKILQMTGDNDGESLNGDEYFAEVKSPALPVEYLPLVKGVDSLPKQNRIIYLLYAIGGVLGLLLSFAGIRIYNLVTSSVAALNGIVSAAAIVFCAIIGVTFGSYPAAKASKLLPIEALHNS